MDFSRKRKRHPNANKTYNLAKKRNTNYCPEIPRSVGNLSQQYFMIARHLQQPAASYETVPQRITQPGLHQQQSEYVPTTRLEEPQRVRVNSVCQINNGLCKVDFQQLLVRKLTEINSETTAPKPMIEPSNPPHEVICRIDYDRVIRERLNEDHRAPPPPAIVVGDRPPNEPRFSIFHSVELMAQSSRTSSTC